MWAMPVIPGTSWADPTFTWVEKEKTGASGRSQTMKVHPLGRVRTVTFFSKSARLWALAGSAAMATRAAATRQRLKSDCVCMLTSTKG